MSVETKEMKRRAFRRIMAVARKAMYKEFARNWRVYDKVVSSAWKAFEERETNWKAFDEARLSAWRAAVSANRPAEEAEDKTFHEALRLLD